MRYEMVALWQGEGPHTRQDEEESQNNEIGLIF